MEKLVKKDKRVYQLTILAFVLICIGMGVACLQYYRHLQDTVRTESSGYMQEISKQMETNVSKTINDNFAVLSTIATVIKSNDISAYTEMQGVVAEHQNHWGYQKIMLIDEKGIAYDDRGTAVSLASDTYLQDVVVSGKPAMSASQVIDGKECIVFAIPIDKIEIEGRNMVALAGCYDLQTFDKILSMTAFDGKGYAHIIRKDGAVVVRSSSPNAMQTGYNILRSLEEAKIVGGSVKQVQTAIANGESGQIEFTLNSTNEYMIYTPLSGQQWSLLTFVPVAVVNAKSNILLKITLLMCSVITIVFALLFAFIMLNFWRNKRKLERIAYVDPITGGDTIARFNEMAKELLDSKAGTQYALVYSNIEKFKVLNEQFGRAACDKILCSIQAGVGLDLESDECMGRQFADNFCILVKYTDEASLAARFDEWQKGGARFMEQSGSGWIPLIVEFGVFVISNNTIPIPHMIDRAKLSLSEVSCELKSNVRYAIYDERVRQILFREKRLEDMMEGALRNHEFEVYLQPKYHTSTEKIGGAEALVRWKSASEGMIYPDEFIPLFEKNGFIAQIDLFVFSEVCRMVRRWIDEDRPVIKVSVNCSRVHLKNKEFLEKYTEVAGKFDIPKNYLELELTENTVFENVEELSGIIRDIHKAGFGCSMDDFGSGYSSLNMIQDIPVDTIKLDRIFFRTLTRDMSRTESVVGSIITMAKALSMETVAEGVEERLQVDMLKRLECDYIQGYYFAKPMPIREFEQLAFGSDSSKDK